MKNCIRFVIPILVILISFIKVSAASPVLASDCTPPNIPTNFSAINGPGAGQVTLYWDQVPGANRYAVAYGINSGNYIYGADHVGEEQSRSYIVSSLGPSTSYYFVLSAAHDSCASGFSKEVMAISTKGTVNPQWPSDSISSSSLQAQPGANSGEVYLSWNDVSESTNYHLVYGTTREVNQYGALNIGKQTHFTVSKLNPNEKYYFSIIPVKNDQVISPIGPVSGYSASSVQMVNRNTINGKINLTVPIEKEQPTVTPSPTMILKELTKSTPTPVVTFMPTRIPTQAPQVSSGPSYFVP